MPSPPTSETLAPAFDTGATLHFILNAKAGSDDDAQTRAAIEGELQAAGRQAELHACDPGDLPATAERLARQARATASAVIAVGGDGTINTVAQAAHAAGSVLGVVPRGTFNYFARAHVIATDAAEATRQLLGARPSPVQVAAVEEVNAAAQARASAGARSQLFLVNASVGLYPDLLEDREAWKARFGRSRVVALWAAAATLLSAQRRFTLQMTDGAGRTRELRTLTLFAGNNPLQLERFGLPTPAAGEAAAAPAAADDNPGALTAVVLKPIGTWAMLGLMLRGAMGTLGDADGVDHFHFEQITLQPRLRIPRWRGAGAMLKVAFDGEVTRMATPLRIGVLPQPLMLLKPMTEG